MSETDSVTEVGPSDWVVRAGWVAKEQVGDEGILYDDRRDRIHVLNSTGSWIWEQCEQEIHVAELVSRFATFCARSPSEVSDDVEALLLDLLGHGLLQRRAAQS